MINCVNYIISNDVIPYNNMAMEELLLREVKKGECILYLWQNQNTVVIGRNQNCRKECKVDELEAAGGYVARRLSGGGAVFHDLGNLNFTFLVRKEDYNVERQLEVILRALGSLGITAEKTGRNDIAAEGRKFSGNAFYSSDGHCYHHGTILINANMGSMTRYLTVSQDKLKAKGVESVKSRVVNLSELAEGITVKSMKTALVSAFGEVYGLSPQLLPMSRIDSGYLEWLTQKFSSWEWRIGNERQATCTINRRFPWGGIEINLLVNGGFIQQADIYTDALEADLFQIISSALVESKFSQPAVAAVLNDIRTESKDTAAMLQDTATLMEDFFNE